MNKLTKLLSVFIIAGAVGASVAGVAGCKKGGGEHSHSIDSTKWTNNLDGTHDGHCSCGELMVDDEAHIYENGECIKCHAPENEIVPGNVTLDTTSSTSSLGREFTIVATISNAAALSDELKVLNWEVEDPTVASITLSADKTTATVKCLAVGTTKITVSTVNGHTAEYNLTVENAATGVKITDANGNPIDRIALTPTSGDITVKAEIQPDGASDTEVVWESSNTSIATVNADANDANKAVVHMVSQGDAPILITATVKGKSVKQSIFCTADTYYGSLVNDTEHLIINENFSKYETDAIVPEWDGDWGTAGVFGSCTKKVATDTYGEGNQVKIVTEANNNNNNRAEMIDTTGSGTELDVAFGAVDGMVKGYANIKMVEYGTSWTFAQIHGKDTGKTTGGEILGLRAASYLKVRVNGTEQDGLVTNIVPQTGDTLRLYYEIDVKNDTAKIYVNGTLFYQANAGDLGITELWGIKFVSSDNGSKRMSLDNIAVTHVGVSVAEHKSDLLAKLDSEYAKYTEADYNAEKWTELTTAYNTAKTAINAATDKAVMNGAYDTAVAAMKAVPTKAGEELYNAKEAYKAEIAEAYPAASYTYNEAAYTAAMNKLVAAIDAYSGEVGDKTLETGLYGDNAIKAAANELAAVKNDTDAMTAAKDAYKAEIAEAYPAANYTINATDYQTKYNAVISAINNYSGAIADIKTDTTISGLVTTLAAVKTDAQELEAAKTAAIEEINNYKKAEIEALKDAEVGTAEATVYSNIQGVISRRTGAVETATSITGEQGVEWNVAEAKQNIDSLLESLNKTLDEVKTDELALLKAEYDKAVAAHSDIKAHLDKVYNAAVTNINNATEKTAATNIRIAATTELNVVIAKDAAYKEIVDYATEVKADLHSESAKADIDKEILYDLNSILTATPDPSGWSAHMWAIHNSTVISGELADGTKVGVNVTKQVVLDTIDKIAADAKNATFEVTLGATGETLTVKYGTELKLGDLFVTAYNVTAAEYNGTAITADVGVAVYDDITIDVTLAEIEDFVPSAEWRVAAEATDVANIVNNSLVSVTSNGGDVYTNGSFSIAGKEFTRWWTSANIVSPTDKTTGAVNEIHDNKATPLVIKAKQTLKSLTVYVTLADSAGTGNNRHGTIYAVINGGEPIALKTLTSKGDMSVAWKPEGIKAGDLIEIYAVNENASGARLHLFGIDAAIDESKVEQTVHVTWKGAGEGGADVTETFRYYETVALHTPPAGNGEFIGWYGPAKFNGGKLTGGDYVMVAKFEYTVKITYNDGTDHELYYNVANGSALEDKLPTLPAKGNQIHTGWSLTEGGAKITDYSTITVGNATTPAEINLYPVYETSTAVLVTEINVTAAGGATSVEKGKTLQLTATTNADADDKTVTWSTSDDTKATVNESGLVTGVAEGSVTITATANDGSGVTGTITLTISKPSGPVLLQTISSFSNPTSSIALTGDAKGYIEGDAIAASKGSSGASANGDKQLKMESSTKLNLTTVKACTLKITLAAGAGLNLDGTKVGASDGVVTLNLEANKSYEIMRNTGTTTISKIEIYSV